MAPKYIIALGLLLDIIGVCLLTIALISGRKGRLNDLRESMVRTTKIWDTHLEEIEQRLKPAYTQDGYALLAEDATHSRETARTQIQEKIDAIEQVERRTGFWVEVMGLGLVVIGFSLQVFGTLAS
jgi:hypothetical protein